MLEIINFENLLNTYIDKVINNKLLLENGFNLDKNNSCQELILSILYRLEPVYSSPNIDCKIKETILSLYEQLK